MSAYGSHAAKLKEMQEELKVKHRRNGELEGAIEVKEAELKEAQTLMEKVKSLHMEQCKELEHQIEEVANAITDAILLIVIETSIITIIIKYSPMVIRFQAI